MGAPDVSNAETRAERHERRAKAKAAKEAAKAAKAAEGKPAQGVGKPPSVPTEVYDLGMRNHGDRDGAAKRAGAARASAERLSEIDKQAAAKLAAAKQKLADAEASLTQAQALVVGELEGTDPQIAAVTREAEEADLYATAYQRLAGAVSQAVGGDADGGLKVAQEYAAGSQGDVAVAALYVVGLIRFGKGDWDGATAALSDTRVVDQWKIKVDDLSKKDAQARLRRLPGELEQRAGKARERAAKAKDAQAKLEQKKLAKAQKGLDQASKELKDAHVLLEQARAAVPADFAGDDTRAAFRAEADAAEKEKASYDRMAAALAAYDAGNHGEAARLAEEAAAGLDGDAALDARYLTALALYKAGDAKGAAALLEKDAIQKRYRAAPRLYALALFAAGDKKGAVKAFRKLTISDEDVEALSAYATALSETGDAKQAREVAARAAKSNPMDRALLISMAKGAMADKKYADAIEPLERAVTLDGKDKDTMWLLAVAYEKSGRGADAQRVLRGWSGRAGGAAVWRDADLARPGHDLYVVPLYPISGALPSDAQSDAARLYLAVAALSAGHLDAAEAELTTLDTPTSMALYARGVIALRQGRLEDAKTWFEAASAEDAKAVAPVHALGVVALRRDDLDSAGYWFNAAGKLAGKDAAPKIGLAVLAAKQGKLDAAIKQFDGVGKDATWGAVARLDQAVALRQNKKHADAGKLLAKATGAAGYPEAAMLAGLLAQDKKDHAGALKQFGKALGVAPDYVDALRAVALAANAAGEPAIAARALRRLVDRSPDDLDARELLANALEASGDVAGAQREKDAIARERKKAKEQLRKDAREGAMGIGAFENTAGNEEYAWLSQGIPEALTTDLKNTGLKIVERAQIAKAVQEQQLGEFGIVDPDTAPKVGQMVGAQAMIVGSFQIQGDMLRMDARLVDTTDGHIIQVATAEGPLDTLFALERRLAMDLIGEYYALDENQKKKVYKGKQTTIKSLEKVAAARLLSIQGQEQAANEMFVKAMEEDPEYAKEVAKFSKEWSALSATVACLPLTNISGNKEQDWYARGIAEALTGDLKRLGILVVERLEINKVMEEKRFTDLFGDTDQAQAAGTKLGASMVVVGSYQAMGGRLQIDVRIVEVETGQIILAERVVGDEQGLFELEEQLAQKIIKILNRPVTEESLKRMREGKPKIEDFKKQIKRQSEVAIAAEPGAKVDVKVMAVGTFDNLSGGEADAEIGERLAANIARELSKQPRLSMVDRQAVIAALKAGQNPKDVGLAVGADTIVIGSYQVVQGRVRVEGKAVSTKTGEILVGVKAEGTRDELDRIEADLTGALIFGLGLQQDKDKGRSTMGKLARNKWFWGGVGAVVVGGVVTAIVLSSGDAGLPGADSTIDCSSGTCVQR